MSKYTKALEKLQMERGNEPQPNGKESPMFKDVATNPSHTQSAHRQQHWGNGIGVSRKIQPDNRVVTLRFPDSVIAEQYRMLRTSLKEKLNKEKAKVLMVSSSMHSEGKTLTSVNLAVSLAETGDCKVALIDADLRRGKVADYLGIDKKHAGLSDFLQHDLTPKQAMTKTNFDNLFVMTRGELVRKPSDLISSSKFQLLITELRASFDYIIIDAPPIMSVADAGILGRSADGILFIIQIGRTPKSVIAHSNQLFRQAGLKMFGYVLTNVEFQTADYRYYQNYYYDEGIESRTFKQKTKQNIKIATWNIKSMEERFNNWWDSRVLKNSKKKIRRNHVPEAIAPENAEAASSAETQI